MKGEDSSWEITLDAIEYFLYSRCELFFFSYCCIYFHKTVLSHFILK